MDELQQQKEIELFKNSFKEDESWQPQNKNVILAGKYKHRLTRKQFWPQIILGTVLVIAVQLLFQYLFDQLPTIDDYHNYYLYRAEIMPKKYGYLFIEFLLLAPLVYWGVWLQAGRLHDIGKSAGTMWWRVVPIVGDIYLTYLLCKPTPTIHHCGKQTKSKKISSQNIAKCIYWIALYLSLLFFSLLPLLCTSAALYPSECRTYFFLTFISILSVFLSVAFCFRDKNPLYDFSLIKKEKQRSLSAGNFFFHSILSSISFVLIICFYYFRVEIKSPGSLCKMFAGTFYTTFLPRSEQFWADIAGTVAIVSTLLFIFFWIALRILRLRSINLTFSQKIVFFIPIIGDIYHIYLLCRSTSAIAETIQPSTINKEITPSAVSSEYSATSEDIRQRIDNPVTAENAENSVKESELLAAYRAHPELRAGIDALLGISNQDVDAKSK